MSKLELTLTRKVIYDNSVIGHLTYINSEGKSIHLCETLEPNVSKYRPKGPIPEGTYDIILNRSPRFGKILPRLLNVPRFQGILIHAGNTWYDTLGCILVGRNVPQHPSSLLSSQIALKSVIDLIQKYDRVTITITKS